MKKIIKYLFIGLLILLAMPILYAYLAYPAEYVNRPLRWGESDVYDYQKFPERALDVSDSPFEFSLNLDEDRVRTQFEAVSGMDDFDSFLAKNRTQAFVIVRKGEWVRYGSPGPDGAEYVAVCMPAFSPDTVHRDV